MFDYVGGKIKGVAVVICWLGIICSCILGIMNIVNGMKLNGSYYGDGSGTLLIIEGVVIMVAGSIGSWLGSLMTYGFGELVETCSTISTRLQDVESKIDKINNGLPTSNATVSSSNKADLSRAVMSNTPIASQSKPVSESEELYKMLSDCETAENMLECVKSGYPSYKNVIAVLKPCVTEEQQYGRSYKMKALGEVKKVLGI